MHNCHYAISNKLATIEQVILITYTPIIKCHESTNGTKFLIPII